MIEVSVLRNKNHIFSIKMRGHANYADAGEDLVCAGASSISVGMMNALDQLVQDACVLELKENSINIKVKRDVHDVQLLLSALVAQLTTLEETYPNYININDQEVYV